MASGFGKAIAGLGALAGGWAQGRDIAERSAARKEDREYLMKQRDREDKKLAAQDEISAAISQATSGEEDSPPSIAPGLGTVTPRAPQMSQAQATPPMPQGQSAPTTLQSAVREAVGMGDTSQMSQGQYSPQMSQAQATPEPATAPAGLAGAPKLPAMLAQYKRTQAGIDAGMKAAARNGNMEAFTDLFNKGNAIRGIVRDQQREIADREHALSGGKDFMPYARIFTDMVDDGTQISDIAANPDGSYVLKGTDRAGKAFETPVKDAAEMRNLVGQIFDPATARKLEAQKAAKLWELNAEITKATAVEAAKAGFKEPEVVKRGMGADAPDQIGTMKGGKITWQTGDGNAADEARPLDKKTTDSMRTTVMGLYKVSDMDSMNPDIRQKVGNAMTYGSMLLQSNMGTNAGRRLDINTAAKIASDMAEGILPEARMKDPDGNIWRGVTVNGVFYRLDPTPVQAGGGAKAPGLGSTGGGMRVPSDVQAQRDIEAGKLMVNEQGGLAGAKANLAELDKAIAKERNSTSKKILQSERLRLAAGIKAVEPGSGGAKSAVKTAPAEALAYLKKNPAAAEQFKNKYGYLPEGF
jgi:hypothetical protein